MASNDLEICAATATTPIMPTLTLEHLLIHDQRREDAAESVEELVTTAMGAMASDKVRLATAIAFLDSSADALTALCIYTFHVWEYVTRNELWRADATFPTQKAFEKYIGFQGTVRFMVEQHGIIGERQVEYPSLRGD